MKRILSSIVFLAMAMPAPVLAQGVPLANVVSACGAQSLPAGTSKPVSQDTAGNSCTAASATVAVAPVTSTNLSGTISVSNTFQPIQAATGGRQGCLIQNKSTSDPMWVFFGPIGSATEAHAFELDTTHGLQISCAVGGLGVSTDQVSITGTSTDVFTANFQ